MGGDPSTIFVRSATAALDRARAQLEQDRWALGIEAASADALRTALDQGVRAAANTCSVSPDAVRALLPSDRIEAALAQLAPLQEAALRTAQAYASSFSGFLARSIHVEDATPGAYLRALASHHSADEFISGPLAGFADALGAWQELLELCARELGSNRTLASSFRKRRVLRAGLVLLAASLACGAVLSLGWWWLVAEAARKRLQASIDNPDPCAVETVRPADRAHASTRQTAALAERASACGRKRDQELAVSRCMSLADHVQSNQLTADDDAAAGASSALLKRVAGSTLAPEDLLIDPAVLPCEGTPAHDRLRAAFGKRAAASSGLWAQAEKLSPAMVKLLTTPEFALTAESQAQLAAHADTVSRRAIVVGAQAEMAHAEALCELQRTLGAGPPGRGCKALQRLRKK